MEAYDKLEELQERLAEYCEVENDEHGEYVRGLCQVSKYSYCMGDEFLNALIAQMEWESENYRKFCRITRTTENYTREFVELEWNAS